MEKGFSKKIQLPYMIKVLEKFRIQGTYINIIKTIYDKLRTLFVFNKRKTQNTHTKIKNKTRVSTFL